MKSKGIGTRRREKLEGKTEAVKYVGKEYMDKVNAHDKPKECSDYETIKNGFHINSKSVCEEFKYDETNKDVIQAMCYYFAQDERFLECDTSNRSH